MGLIIPDEEKPKFNLYIEGYNKEYAEELWLEYDKKIRELKRNRITIDERKIGSMVERDRKHSNLKIYHVLCKTDRKLNIRNFMLDKLMVVSEILREYINFNNYQQ